MQNSTIAVELPETLREFVESEAQALAYSSPGEFLRSLAEDSQDRRAALEAHLLENLNSKPINVPHEVLERGELVSFLERSLGESR